MRKDTFMPLDRDLTIDEKHRILHTIGELVGGAPDARGLTRAERAGVIAVVYLRATRIIRDEWDGVDSLAAVTAGVVVREQLIAAAVERAQRSELESK
jgi:hypothetical protein